MIQESDNAYNIVMHAGHYDLMSDKEQKDCVEILEKKSAPLRPKLQELLDELNKRIAKDLGMTTTYNGLHKTLDGLAAKYPVLRLSPDEMAQRKAQATIKEQEEKQKKKNETVDFKKAADAQNGNRKISTTEKKK